MLFNAKNLKLSLNNTEFDYISFGQGAKPLVMIQGLNTRGLKGAALSLAYMYRIFAKDYKVYLFDRRPDVQEGITVKDIALDIAGAMDKLGLSNACVLGVSQGGMIAQHLAIERPDLVGKLALAVTLSKNNDTVETVINNWVSLTERGDMKGLVGDMAAQMYSEAYVKRYMPLMPLLTILQKPKDMKRFVILARACLTCDAYEQLDKIHCPVFVIGGRKDKVVSGEASEEIAERLGCKVYMYENLGHAAYEEAKDFNFRVLDFFKERENFEAEVVQK
ncbi:alpha/beta hydrolase [Clostridiaceae bacterium OttesenSCG-928-D20]|nr:alpha/beta hydrolase [Clostridiaceae bacterium OttesenSCG-928-D20]